MGGQRVILTVGTAALAIVLLLFIWRVAEILLLAFSGVLFGLAMYGGAEWVSRKASLPIKISLALLVAAFTILTAAGAYAATPRIAEQIDILSDTIPQLIGDLRLTLGKYGWGQFLLRQMNDFQVGADSQLLLGGVRGALGTVTWSVVGALVVFFTGLYVAFAPGQYVRGIVILVPPQSRKRAREVLAVLKRQLQRWLLGRIASMLVVTILTAIGLWLLDVPLAFTLAILAGFLSFIPNIGPTISAFVAAFVALAVGWQLALFTILLFIGVQLVESYLITPLIERRSVALPPAFVIVAQLMLGVLFGFLGLLVATPLAVVVVVLVRMLYVEDVLGERPASQKTS